MKKRNGADDPYADTDDASDDGDTEDTEVAKPLSGRNDDVGLTGGTSDASLPWIYRRSSITDNRDTKQLHVQTETLDRERQVKSQLDSMMNQPVKKADLREAAYLVGLSRINELVEQLNEWGYES